MPSAFDTAGSLKQTGGTGTGGTAAGALTALSSQSQASGTSLSYAMPGGTLGTDGDLLVVEVAGRTDAGSGETVQVTLGASILTNFALGADTNFLMRILCRRTGSAAQFVNGQLVGVVAGTSASVAKAQVAVSRAETLANAHTLAANYSTAGHASRVIYMLTVQKVSAP